MIYGQKKKVNMSTETTKEQLRDFAIELDDDKRVQLWDY